MEALPREPANPAILSATLLRTVGTVLDECSAQGLQVWTDPAGRWYWRWAGTNLAAQRGLWAMGEAIIDAVATRFPAAFEFPLPTSANDERHENRA